VSFLPATRLSRKTIFDFENRKRVSPSAVAEIRYVLENAGVDFTNGDEPKVKLRKTKGVVIEPETPGDSRSLFRPLVGEKIIAERLTAAQAHNLIGDILEKMTLPKETAATREKAAVD
jgi:hypothetical protein